MHSVDLTIAEAAQTLGVSKDTIRRRIKAGEIKAEMRPSPYGDQYYINPIELTGAVRNVDVVKIEQTITPEELTGLLKQAMQDAIAPLHREIAALKAELAEARNESIKKEVEHEAESKARDESRDQQLVALIREIQGMRQEIRRPWWKKLFKT